MSTASNRTESTLAVSATERRDNLPDYGKTPVEIDQIVVKPKKNKKSTSNTSSNNKNEPNDDDENPWRRRDLFGTSLLDQTLDEMKEASSSSVPLLTKEERIQRRRALDSLGIPEFRTFVQERLGKNDEDDKPQQQHGRPIIIRRDMPEVLQINIGLYCNQACGHCHVESSPLRTSEQMTAETASRCLDLLRSTPSIHTLDITGGAPELNANFRTLVSMARHLRPDLKIIDRCNLTVLQEPGQEDLVDFLRRHRVHIVASLPCYSAENVNKQRGKGVFDRSIAALLALNEAGYGLQGVSTTTTAAATAAADDDTAAATNNKKDDEEKGESDEGNDNENDDDDVVLELDLVYNPLGAFLPPPQKALESKYKEVLQTNFGIVFDQLYTMTNMPIKRFADYLYRNDELEDYMELLVRNFNSDTTSNLMCRNTISIGWDGKIYDCDFNQQLGYGLSKKERNDNDDRDDREENDISSGGHDPTTSGLTVFDLNNFMELQSVPIRNDNHCFGCTAGMGSS